jgi:hypothetical protein
MITKTTLTVYAIVAALAVVGVLGTGLIQTAEATIFGGFSFQQESKNEQEGFQQNNQQNNQGFQCLFCGVSDD